MAKNELFVALVVLLFITDVFGVCTPAEQVVTSGTPVSGTTVAGGINYYSYTMPNSGNYFLMATVRETSTPTNSIEIYYRNLLCPDTTTFTYGATASVAANGYNSVVFPILSSGSDTYFFGVYSATGGIAYTFTFTIVPSTSVLTATNGVTYNVFGTSTIYFNTTQTGPWQVAYRYTSVGYSSTVTSATGATKVTTVSTNTNTPFDSCSSFAASTSKLSIVGTSSSAPSAGFTLSTLSAVTTTAATNSTSLTNQVVAAGASITYLFNVPLSNTILAAVITETAATKDNLVLYWGNEVCASASSNFFTHGTSTDGRYYSYVNTNLRGYISLTVSNPGGSSSTFNIQLAQDSNYFTIPTGYDINGFLSSYNSITFAATGTADQLLFTARGYYVSMYSSASFHPTSSTYEYYNTTSLSSATFNRTIAVDGCGATPGRNEINLYYGTSTSTTFVLKATDVSGGSFAVAQLVSGTAAVGAIGTTPTYYYISNTVGYNLKITFVDGDAAGLTLRVFTSCPSASPSAIKTYSGSTSTIILAYASRTYFSIVAPSGSRAFSLKVDVSEVIALTASQTTYASVVSSADNFYLSFTSATGGFSLNVANSGFYIYAKNGTKPTTSNYDYYNSGSGTLSTPNCYSGGSTTWYFLADAYSSSATLAVTPTQTGNPTLVSGTPVTTTINTANDMSIFRVSTTLGKTLTFQITTTTANYDWYFRIYSTCPYSSSYYQDSIASSGTQSLNFVYAAPSSEFYVFIYDYYAADTFTVSYTETDVTSLTNGAQSNAILSTGSWIYYTYQATGPFTIGITGYQKYVYARFGAKPDSSNYAISETTTYSFNERTVSTDACSGSANGLWYFGVYSYSSSSYNTANITVTSTGGSSQTLTTLTSVPQTINSAQAYFAYTPTSGEFQQITVSLTANGGASVSGFNVFASAAGCPSASSYTYYALGDSQPKSGNKASLTHLGTAVTQYYYVVYATNGTSYSISVSSVSTSSGISLNSGNTVVGSIRDGEYLYFSIDAIVASFNLEIAGSSVYVYANKGSLPYSGNYITQLYGYSTPYNNTINGCVTSQSIPGRWYFAAYTYSGSATFSIKGYLTGAPTCNSQTGVSTFTSYTTYTSYTTNSQTTYSQTTDIGNTGGQAAICSYYEGSQCTSTFSTCVETATTNSTICNCISDWGYCLVSVFCGNGTASDYSSFDASCQNYGCSREQCNPTLNSRYSGANQLYANSVLVAVLVAALVALFKY